MKRKTKLFFSLVSLCFTLAVLCFGVYSATSVNYSLSGSVSYEVNDVFVNIGTKLYRSTSSITTDEYLQSANVHTFEQGSIPIDVEDSGVVFDDVITYNSQGGSVSSPGEIVEANATLDLQYGGYSAQSNTSFAFYIVLTFSNYGTQPAYATLTNNSQGANLNSLFSVSNDIEIQARGEKQYSTSVMVIAMALDDITQNAQGDFSFNVSVTKNAPTQTLSISNSDVQTTQPVAFKSYGAQTNGLVVETELFDLIDVNTFFQAIGDGYMVGLLGYTMDAVTMGVYHITLNNIDQATSQDVLISLYSGVGQEYMPATMFFGFPGTLQQSEVLQSLMGLLDGQTLLVDCWDKDVHGFILELDTLSTYISNNSLTFTLAVGYLNQEQNVSRTSQGILSVSYVPTTQHNITIVNLDDDSSENQSVAYLQPRTIMQSFGGLSTQPMFYDSNCTNNVSMPFIPTGNITLYQKTFESGKSYNIANANENSTIDLYIANKKYATFTQELLLDFVQTVSANYTQGNLDNGNSYGYILTAQTEGLTLYNHTNIAAVYTNIGGGNWGHLCFDFDGTLSNSHPNCLQVFASFEDSSLALYAFSYDTYDIVKLVYSDTGAELPFESYRVNVD